MLLAVLNSGFYTTKDLVSFILQYKALFVSIIIENIFDVFRLQTDHFLRHGADTSGTKRNGILM
jgi:hypothetical protein